MGFSGRLQKKLFRPMIKNFIDDFILDKNHLLPQRVYKKQCVSPIYYQYLIVLAKKPAFLKPSHTHRPNVKAALNLVEKYPKLS